MVQLPLALPTQARALPILRPVWTSKTAMTPVLVHSPTQTKEPYVCINTFKIVCLRTARAIKQFHVSFKARKGKKTKHNLSTAVSTPRFRATLVRLYYIDHSIRIKNGF